MLGVVAAFAGVGLLPEPVKRFRLPILGGALVATWIVVFVLVEGLPRIFNPGPPVSEAVGGASFAGTPYRGAQFAAVAAMGLIAAAALAVAARIGKLVKAGAAKPESGEEPGVGRRSKIAIAGTALVCLSLAPDLRATMEDAVRPGATTWDTSNFVAWDFFANQGLVPMRDFFYPYGLQWLFDLFPQGPLVMWLARSATLAVIAWALWRLSGHSAPRVILSLLVVAAIGFGDDFLWRYMPAMALPLAYAAMGPAQHRRLTSGHAVFGAAAVLALLLEPDFLLFGIAGMGLVLLGEVCAGRVALDPRGLARSLAVDAVPVAAAVGLVLLSWLAMGTGDASSNFYLGLSTLSAFASPDQLTSGALAEFTARPSLDTVRIILPSLLAAAGFLHALFGRQEAARVSPILLAAAGVTFVMLLKHLVRPADFVIPLTLVAVGWTAVMLWSPRDLTVAALVGASLGALFVSLEDQGARATRYIGDALTAPVDLTRTVAVAFDGGAVEESSRERFDLERFAGSPDLTAVAPLLRATKGEPPPPFTVLGDAQLLYPLFRQRPPFHAELYDASPVAEQQRMLGELEEIDPQLMVWRRDFFWDGVPYNVRSPIVFANAIKGFVPLSRDVTTDVLRPREPGEPIPLRYWRERLGTTVELGYIPSYSRADDAPKCETLGSDRGCAPYALVESSSPDPGETVTLDVRGDAGSFEVTFRAREGVDEYPVRLDRLWFWPLLGESPEVASATPGWEARSSGLQTVDLY